MTEQLPPHAVEDVEAGPEDGGRADVPSGPTEATRTGVPAVDDVIRDVDLLDSRPLEEHLAAFERAHQSLRSALDADPSEPA